MQIPELPDKSEPDERVAKVSNLYKSSRLIEKIRRANAKTSRFALIILNVPRFVAYRMMFWKGIVSPLGSIASQPNLQ